MRFSLVFRLSSLVCIFVSSVLAEAPRVVPEIVDSIPHEMTHFTQGLFFDGKELIETTGLYGKSGLYRRTLDGKILDSARLADKYFGEGSIAVGDDIFYLTWKSKKAFIYSRKPFAKKGEFNIPTEGWGLTYWKNALLMSNGSSELLQIALGGFYVVGVIPVTDGGRPVKLLNELEIVDDTLYANIWQTGAIAVISLPSGKVVRYLDLSRKVAEIQRKYPDVDVLNGIAYDGKNLWITGKNWPFIYKLK
ncbi:MAG: glutaminyl-peptide cyclotransferase [Fibrobacter sp.]|nr:glutaminyl-peptide cyclotransferase [Fibrobacter sp.]